MDCTAWEHLIDRAAIALRLEGQARQRYGLLATLHVIHEIWGELTLLRAAARLVDRHHADLALVGAAVPTPALRAWYATWLAGQREAGAPAGLPAQLLKPGAALGHSR